MQSIQRAVQAVYDALGSTGSRAPPGLVLSTGAALARQLGYPTAEVETLPTEVAGAFVGAGALAAEIREPSEGWVVDLGCGAGIDALLLGRRGLRVAGIDASQPLLRRLARGSAKAGVPAWPVRARLPAVPLRSSFASWVLLNGVANLVPQRTELLGEIRRLLLPGGRLLAADLVALGEIPSELRQLPEAWAWCVGGASSPEEWQTQLETAGLCEVEVRVLEEVPPLGRALIRARRPV